MTPPIARLTAKAGIAAAEAALVRDLGGEHFFMLRNHGLITVADNVPDAFLFLYTFEAACPIQVRRWPVAASLSVSIRKSSRPDSNRPTP